MKLLKPNLWQDHVQGFFIIFVIVPLALLIFVFIGQSRQDKPTDYTPEPYTNGYNCNGC